MQHSPTVETAGQPLNRGFCTPHPRVHSSEVQRGYLCGWLLAGMYGDSPVMLYDRLVFKGQRRPPKSAERRELERLRRN